MKLNKKGLTLIELLSVIVIIAVLGTVAVISYNAIINSSRNVLYDNYENNLIDATYNFIIADYTRSYEQFTYNHKDNELEHDKDCFENNGYSRDYKHTGTVKYSYNLLTCLRVLDDLKDPKGDDTCKDSYTIVTYPSNMSSFKTTNIKACLICGDYKKGDAC